MQQLEEGGPDPLVFVLNANLLAMVKLVNCELTSRRFNGNLNNVFFIFRAAKLSVDLLLND